MLIVTRTATHIALRSMDVEVELYCIVQLQGRRVRATKEGPSTPTSPNHPSSTTSTATSSSSQICWLAHSLHHHLPSYPLLLTHPLTDWTASSVLTAVREEYTEHNSEAREEVKREREGAERRRERRRRTRRPREDAKEGGDRKSTSTLGCTTEAEPSGGGRGQCSKGSEVEGKKSGDRDERRRGGERRPKKLNERGRGDDDEE